VDGKKTGYENNYVFSIDVMQDRFNQFRVIGNENSYKLEVADVPEKPEVISGNEDLIESIEKDEDGFWVVTPAKDASG
ncbi:phosphatidylinositol-specific phospholipase C1-like protein, partial [Klebsiella pneumoniae]|nr:phosphatidylinositol-specific phospholipase C1-like protein [Klebsiella pneumoniae]